MGSALGSLITYRVFQAATGLIRALPLRTVFQIGATVGTIARLVAPGYRALARRNAEIAFGKDRAAQIADESFPRLGANFLSAIKLSTYSYPEIQQHLEGSDGEAMREALKKGKGLIVLVAHLGNWEVLAQFGAMVPGTPVAVVYQSMRNKHIDNEIRKMREIKGMRLIERKDGLGSLLSTLKAGGLVAVLGDQHAGNSGVWSPLFRRLASSSPLAGMLALRSGAPIVPVAALTIGTARWRFWEGKEITLSGHDVASATARINLVVESMIQESPADWFWVHNRWKTPHPRFLLQNYRRGLALPEGATTEALQDFRILIRSSNWLGDCVMTLPAVQAIKNGRPDAHVTLLCREKLAAFWRRVSCVDEVIAIPNKASLFQVAKQIRQAGYFDAGILLPNSPRVALELWLAKVPRRVGLPGKFRKALLNQLIVEKNRPIRPRHQGWDYLAIAEGIGAEKPETLSVSGLLRVATSTTRSPKIFRIAVCPGAEYGPAKRWFPERFAEVIRTVSDRRQCEWVLFGVPKDAECAEQILTQIGSNVTNRVGKTDLGELIDELGACDLLLTNDSGPMHLAAALGIPSISLFGSTEPSLTGPIGDNHRVIRHQVECSPCFLRDCPIDFRCMKAITVSEVVEAILQAMER